MFDLNTLRLISMVGFIGFVFTALMLWHLVPQERSMKHWALAALLVAGGMLLLGLRGSISDFISIVIANTLLMLGVGYMYIGARTLFGIDSRYAWQWPAAALTLLICMVATDVSIRVALTSVLYAAFFLGCASLFWSKGEDKLRLTKRIAACIFTLGAILFVYRALNPPTQALPALYVTTSRLLEVAPYLYALLLSMWMPLTLMLIVSTRLQSERLDAVVRARKTFHELEESEFRWKFAIEGSGDGLWDWDVPAEKVFYSKRWKELLGFSVEDISDGLHEWEQRIHPEDKAGTLASVKNHIDGKTPNYSYEHRLLCKDGTYKWILTRGLVVTRDAAGKPLRIIGTHTDISEAKLQESYIKYRNRVLEILANGEPIEQVLLAIVSGLEAIHPEMLCSILLLGDDGKHLVGGVAPRLPDFYNQAIKGIEIGVGQGSCGTAAFTGERVIVDDIFSHPYWIAFRDIAARAGLAACWSQPIKSSTHQVLGTFAIYHRAPHLPSQADIILIEQSADLVSIALDRNAAEVQLRDREKQLQLVLDASQLGFWDWDIPKQAE